MDIDNILEIARQKLLDLSYTICKKINLSTVKDEQIQARQMLLLMEVLEDEESLLTEEEKQQVLQGIISIGNLNIYL